jgi:hypothetical protein
MRVPKFSTSSFKTYPWPTFLILLYKVLGSPEETTLRNFSIISASVMVEIRRSTATLGAFEPFKEAAASATAGRTIAGGLEPASADDPGYLTAMGEVLLRGGGP